MGERTEFSPQANNTASGRSEGRLCGGGIGRSKRNPGDRSHSQVLRGQDLWGKNLYEKSMPIFPDHALALPVQDRDQREQPARGVEIEIDLALEPFGDEIGSFVMQRAPRHV